MGGSAAPDPNRALRVLAADKALDEATVLADQGRFAEAAKCCEEHLRRYGPSAAVFHLLAVLREASGDRLEAIACFRKSLFLDPGNREVLVHLALLLDRTERR